MNSAPPLGYSEGQNINRPPLFNGQYYSWWKARMEVFIQAEDYELWNIITDGPEYPTYKDAENNDVPKEKSEYNEADYKMLEKNAKAKFILICGLGPDEYNRISNCTTAKQIWDTLMNAHEETGSKKWSNDNSQASCHKRDRTAHMIKKCPREEIEWKKESAEKEMNENAKKKNKKDYDMTAAWGSRSEDSDDEKVDEIAFMAIGDSDMEEEESNSEVSILEIKEKLHLFPKRKLISLINDLIDDFQELTCERDQLLNAFSDQKFECMDLKSCKTVIDKENSSLKKQVDKLDSLNLNLKSEILKLSIIEKGKGVISEDQKKIESDFKECKIDFFCEKEKVKKLNLEVSRLIMDLERANRWTNSSRIVNKLSGRVHNEKAGIGFHKENVISEDLCYICGKFGHPNY